MYILNMTVINVQRIIALRGVNLQSMHDQPLSKINSGRESGKFKRWFVKTLIFRHLTSFTSMSSVGLY